VTDERGSVRLVVNASTGAVVSSLNYDVWGNVTSSTNATFQPFGFAGGLRDDATNLTHFGAREYAPELGRWTRKDPIGFNGGLTDLYGYVGNDPVNWVDLSGNDPGDTYETATAATIAALSDAYRATKASSSNLSSQIEYGGWIETANGGYTYSDLIEGDGDQVTPGAAPQCAVGAYHSHTGNNNAGFSDGDIDFALTTGFVALANPNGKLQLLYWSYDPSVRMAPATWNVINLGKVK